MSTWKSAVAAVTAKFGKPKRRLNPDRVEADQPIAKAKEPTLKIDDDHYAGGCDPYNRTGQFCVDEFKD